MGLDQSIHIIKNYPDLKNFYGKEDKDYESFSLLDDIVEDAPFDFYKDYAVQQFMFELAQKNGGIKEHGEFYATPLRITLDDLRKLYALTAEQLTKLAKRWTKNAWPYDDHDVERIHSLCHQIAGYIAFDDEYAAYFDSDW